jgi:hypothetical protein
MANGDELNRYLKILVLAAICTAPVHAQEGERTVAKLVDVHGNVLVSHDTGLASGTEKLRLAAGTRVITTAKSDAIVEYDDGCRVHLKENQRFEVERGKPCALLLAQDVIAAPLAGFNYATVLIPLVLGAAAVGGTEAGLGGPTGGTASLPPPVSPN